MEISKNKVHVNCRKCTYWISYEKQERCDKLRIAERLNPSGLSMTYVEHLEPEFGWCKEFEKRKWWEYKRIGHIFLGSLYLTYGLWIAFILCLFYNLSRIFWK
jgi:hypothetical protein